MSHTPRPPHTDVDTQASRVSGLCKVGSCSVPSGPMNATVQQLVFLIVVLADADGIEIIHNSGQLCVRSHPPSPFLLFRVDKGMRDISPLHTYHGIVVFSCLTHSSGGGGGIFARGTIPLPSGNHERIVSFCLHSNPCSTHPEPVRVFVTWL